MAAKRQRLALRRKAVGFSQEQLAERLGVERSTVVRWENGETGPQPWIRPKLSRALQVTIDQLDELLNDLGNTEELAGERDAYTDEYPIGHLVARLAASRGLSHGDVRLMQRQVDQVRRLDRQLGAPAVLEQLRALILTTTELMTYSLRPQVRESLAAVVADAGALAGWQALDLGAIGQAWRNYELAKTAAREANDATLLAHAMAEQAFALLDLGQAPVAVDLIREAQTIADGHGPQLLSAWLRAAEAEAHASCNNDRDCRRALDVATATLPEDTSDPALPFIFLSDAHLARWRGNCLAKIGDATAIGELTTSLKAMDSSFTRAEASLRCDLAHALIICGELGEAKRHARRARQLAIRIGSVRQRRRIERLASVPVS